MTTLDPEKQKQAKQYSRIRRRLWLVDTVFSAVYALRMAFPWLEHFTPHMASPTDHCQLVTDHWL